jgi:hypothetical protein
MSREWERIARSIDRTGTRKTSYRQYILPRVEAKGGLKRLGPRLQILDVAIVDEVVDEIAAENAAELPPIARVGRRRA